MRASLDNTARLAVLADLGIDVWRLRGAPDQTPDVVDSAAPENSLTVGLVPPPPSPRAAASAAPLPAEVAPPGSAAKAERSSRSAGSASGAPGPHVRPDAAFSLVALGQPGALLLLAAEPVGREARFARDLLAAAARNHRDTPVSRRFDWPPAPGLPGIDQPGASERAFAAFLDKARADIEARHLLVDPIVAPRIIRLGLSMSVITLPALADLARDGSAKRALWAALASPVGGPSG